MEVKTAMTPPGGVRFPPIPNTNVANSVLAGLSVGMTTSELEPVEVPQASGIAAGGTAEVSQLRHENEKLKRELVDKLRGGHKFVSGGQFRGQGNQQCKSCSVSARAFADVSRQLQREQKLRQAALDDLELEEATAKRLQHLVDSLQQQLAAHPPKGHLSGLEAEVAKLRRDNEELETSNQKLQTAVDSAHTRVASLQADMEANQANFAAREAQWEASAAALEARARTVEARATQLGDEKCCLERELTERDATLKYAHEQQDKAEARCTDLDTALRDAQEALHQALEGDKTKLQELAAAADKATKDRDAATAMVDALHEQQSKVEADKEALRKKLQGAMHAAALVAKLEAELARCKQSMGTLEDQAKQDQATIEDLQTRNFELTGEAAGYQADLDEVRREREALHTHLRSMVQLVVVAPSVNVSLGQGGGKVCSPGMQNVELRVIEVIEKEIMPSFMQVYSKPAKGVKEGEADPGPAVPEGFVQRLVADMQKTIGEHLRPVLADAWKHSQR